MAQNPHLVAYIVDIVLTLHRVSSGIEKRANYIANDGTPSVANMKRPSRIRGDELD